jgi:ABC-type dipeptide/oligopeptide/nickel transport system permease component/ABC-type dipeptide/oligopeptide/nickel transport system permease subunit
MAHLSTPNEMNHSPLSTEEFRSPVPADRPDRWAAWVQFPRRVIILLIAFSLASLLIEALPGFLPGNASLPEGLEQDQGEPFSLVTRQPVADMLADFLPNTLFLLGAALVLALLLVLPLILIAILAHKLEEGAGPVGSVLKGLGRLVVFGLAAWPVFALGLFFLYVFAFQLRWLPIGGMFSPTSEGTLAGRLPHLILPALTLALLPAMLTAQAVAREVTLPGQSAGFRLWLIGLFQMLGTLLGQVGGLLSASVLVETLFSWPGLGRLIINSAMQFDFPVLVGVLGAYSGLILAGQLAAEFFHWLKRLAQRPTLLPQPVLSSRPKNARLIWVIATLALLLIPLTVVLAGLTVDPDKAVEMDLQSRGDSTSAEHPWGTDRLGRDLQARVLRGSLVTVGTAVLAAAVALPASALIGALTGFLASRRKLWAESLADLLLLPADILLFIPAVPSGLVILLLLGTPTWLSVTTIVALVLLPRTIRVYQTVWLAAPQPRRGWLLGTAGLGVLFLGTLFAGISLTASLEFLGFAAPPPLPSLGSVLNEGLTQMAASPTSVQVAAVVLWACTFPCYTAADALVGFFYSKVALARLND